MSPSALSQARIWPGLIALGVGLAAAGVAAAQTPVVVEGVSADLRLGIARALPEREEPQSMFDAERLSDEAAARAKAWLRAEGYYGADVTSVPTDSPPTARIRATPGPLFVLDTPVVDFVGDAPTPDAQSAAHAALSVLTPGAPARAADVLRAEAQALAALRASGYPDAKANPRRVVVDHAKHVMSAKFAFDAGALVKLGVVRISPPDLLRKTYIKRLKAWDYGATYSPDTLSTLRRDLASTGTFSTVTTALSDTASQDGVRDVIVTLETAKAHVVEFGAGWSTTEGAGVEAKWTKRNVTRRADSLTLDASLAEQRQSLSADLSQPNAVGPGRTMHLAGELVHDTSGPFVRTGIAASAAVDAARRLKYAVTYGVSAAADFYSQANGVENAIVFSTFADIRRETTDSVLDPRKGYYLQARLEPGLSTGDATVPYARITAQARGYDSPRSMPRLTLAGRTRAGWIEPLGASGSNLPLDRLFYAGGGGSVRGYDFNSIYPAANANQSNPPGGRGLLELSGEARTRLTRRIGVVGFADGGAAFNEITDAGRMRWGAGVGVRYDLGFAPLRFDIAAPISPRPNDARVAFYVSIGQAF